MKTLTRHTKAGKDGKDIGCPQCKTVVRVYHLGWTALQCIDCGNMIKKSEWQLYS